jgi:hypothetical protein
MGSRVVVIGTWALMQSSRAGAILFPNEGGGIAYTAHVGGFIAGCLGAIFKPRGERPRRVTSPDGRRRAGPFGRDSERMSRRRRDIATEQTRRRRTKRGRRERARKDSSRER